MKKLLAILLCLVMVLSTALLVGCSSDSDVEGTWEATKTAPNGIEAIVTIEFKEDGKGTVRFELDEDSCIDVLEKEYDKHGMTLEEGLESEGMTREEAMDYLKEQAFGENTAGDFTWTAEGNEITMTNNDGDDQTVTVEDDAFEWEGLDFERK
ncbi:MAG: hypothetical protein IKT68_08500 [Clostridia bacterium]|nr:hypothetical protein [Clostridia bacterium]